jgi:hypothetical protein
VQDRIIAKAGANASNSRGRAYHLPLLNPSLAADSGPFQRSVRASQGWTPNKPFRMRSGGFPAGLYLCPSRALSGRDLPARAGGHRPVLPECAGTLPLLAFSLQLRPPRPLGCRDTFSRRCLAGTSNFKAKYAGNFPRVAIIDAAPGRMTTPEALESLGLVAPQEPAPTVVRFKTSGNPSRLGAERSWPDYELCVKGATIAKEGGPDRSMADFFWCMMAAQRGHSIEDIASKLLEVSAKAQERARLHDGGYALVTAQNATAAAERGRKRGRG